MMCITRGGREKVTEETVLIQTISAAEADQPIHWCMETCAGHVCMLLRSLHIQRDTNRPGSTNELILVSESQQAREPLQYLSGVLDPLVSALSDLRIVHSHLIMVQSPWIFKEWLSDTCQTSLTRLMKSAAVTSKQTTGLKRRFWVIVDC